MTNTEPMTEVKDVPLLVRREIEALIAAPLIRAFAEEIGMEKAAEIAGEVIRGLAKEAGRSMAAMVEDNTVENFVTDLLPIFKKGALDLEMVMQSEGLACWDTTRCRYAEMYKRLGLEDMGFILSCGRDAALFEGYNPDIRFTRTQTVMEGGRCCDFCLEAKKDTRP